MNSYPNTVSRRIILPQPDAGAKTRALILTLILLSIALLLPHTSSQRAGAGALPQQFRMYLPIVRKPGPRPCDPIPWEHYTAIPVVAGTGSHVPAEQHPDINLALRGYRENPTAYRGLVEYGGHVDPHAPQLLNLFADLRDPVFLRVYQVHQWDGQWPGQYGIIPITDPEVTLVGLAARQGETIHLPDRSPDIYQGRYIALVLYATPERITIKYTREDNVIHGYTVHIEGICVEPRLVALYQQSVAGGRRHLPGLQRGQAIGRARGTELGVAIRDVGSFMDPRSRKDWWQSLVKLPLYAPQVDASNSPWFLSRQRTLAERTTTPPAR